MERAAAFELRLDRGIERVVGGGAAGEQRVAAIARDLERIEQRAVVRQLVWIMSWWKFISPSGSAPMVSPFSRMFEIIMMFGSSRE